ncbi:MAG TPA: CPBP family intramembrane glutamic endopeptidase [Verrucomicrobiae bacterium]|nr:CPBP family intramembrane glutamic endopeptidase [Verrucomicrobiae bacterium]
MLWKKTWELEAVLMLIGGIVVAFFLGNIAAGLLLQAHVNGFKTEFSIGTVLLATLSFHGTAIVLGTGFLIFHGSEWRDVLGSVSLKRSLVLACGALVVVTPVIIGLEYVSEFVLKKMHWPVESQEAVKMILDAPPGIRVYLAIFATVIAPMAEEFFFRGLLFSLAKQYGWPKLGWFGVSFLFALMHVNAPTFLPLFALALALTWLCEKTDGLLAPIMAHSLFNTVNLAILLLADKYATP